MVREVRGRVRLLVEVGLGIEQHGQDPTRACVKAVKDAISRVCIPCIKEYFRAGNEDIDVDVLLGVPNPNEVRIEEVTKALPIGNVNVRVVNGGLKARCIKLPELGDKSDEMLIAVAAITVYVRRGT